MLILYPPLPDDCGYTQDHDDACLLTEFGSNIWMLFKRIPKASIRFLQNIA